MTFLGGLIKFSKYATQVGQLHPMTRSGFGDTVATSPSSVTTIKMLVYTLENEQQVTNPAMTEAQQHFAILPRDVTIQTGDRIKNVVDQFGNVVLLDSRIEKIIPYHHWRYADKFKAVRLDVNLAT